MTFAILILSTIPLQPSRLFFKVVGGEVVNVPVIWYLPSPPLTEGVGSPSLSVPMKAMLETRSRTTVSLAVTLRLSTFFNTVSIPSFVGLKPGKARETTSIEAISDILHM
jgi:hypothetical protein